MPRKTPVAAVEEDLEITCFNEAAARCRGKHGELASAFFIGSSFNEAAARCRGKRQETDGNE